MSYARSKVIKGYVRDERESLKDYEYRLKLAGLMRIPTKQSNPTKKRKTDKKKYQLHLVWNLGRDGETWVPLGMFSHLDGAYKKITKMREHHARERMRAIERGSKTMRTPILYLEFRKGDNKSNNARCFNMYPECTFGMFKPDPKTGTPPLHEFYHPKGFILMPSYKLKKKRKRRS